MFHCGLCFWLHFKDCTILIYLNSEVHSREMCAGISFYLFHFVCDRFIVCFCQAANHPLNNMNIQELSAAAASLIFLKNSNTCNDNGFTFVCSIFTWDVPWYYYFGNFFGKDWEILMVTLEIHQLGWWRGMEWGGGVGTHQTKDLSV